MEKIKHLIEFSEESMYKKELFNKNKNEIDNEGINSIFYSNKSENELQ